MVLKFNFKTIVFFITGLSYLSANKKPTDQPVLKFINENTVSI